MGTFLDLFLIFSWRVALGVIACMILGYGLSGGSMWGLGLGAVIGFAGGAVLDVHLEDKAARAKRAEDEKNKKDAPCT